MGNDWSFIQIVQSWFWNKFVLYWLSLYFFFVWLFLIHNNLLIHRLLGKWKLLHDWLSIILSKLSHSFAFLKLLRNWLLFFSIPEVVQYFLNFHKWGSSIGIGFKNIGKNLYKLGRIFLGKKIEHIGHNSLWEKAVVVVIARGNLLKLGCFKDGHSHTEYWLFSET